MNNISNKVNLYRQYVLTMVVHNCVTVIAAFGLTFGGLALYFNNMTDLAAKFRIAEIIGFGSCAVLLLDSFCNFLRSMATTQFTRFLSLSIYGILYGMASSIIVVAYKISSFDVGIAAMITSVLAFASSYMTIVYGVDKKVIELAQKALLFVFIFNSLLVAAMFFGLIGYQNAILFDSLLGILLICALVPFIGMYVDYALKVNPTDKEEADKISFEIGLGLSIMLITIFREILILIARSKDRK